MSRFSWNQPASLTDSISTTPEVGWNGAENGMVFIPVGSSITSLTFHAADCPEGDFHPLYRIGDSGPEAVTLTVAADRAVPLPSDLRGCRAFKAVANAAGAVKFSFQE